MNFIKKRLKWKSNGNALYSKLIILKMKNIILKICE